MSNEGKVIGQLRDLAGARPEGVTAVVEVSLKFAAQVGFDGGELTALSEAALRSALAEKVDELLEQMKTTDCTDVGRVLAVRDAHTDEDIPLPTPAREVFAGYLGFDGVSIQADFDVPVGASAAEKDLAFMAVLAQKANLDYLSMGVTAPGEVKTDRAEGKTDRLSAVPVAFWGSRVYGQVHAEGDKDFICEIDDQRQRKGQVFVTLAPANGEAEDTLTLTAEVNRLPGSVEDVQCVRLEMGDAAVAVFYKQGDTLIVRPESGLRTRNTVLPNNEAAWIWE